MEKSEAHMLVRSLMDHHGLKLWKLEWMNLKTTAGLCYNNPFTWNKNPELSRGRIELSEYHMTAFTEAQVRETGLHEIAHALVPPGVQSHGPEWKHMAKKIGSTGERCVSMDEAMRLTSRYKGTCPQGHEFPRHRKSRDMSYPATHFCPPCRKKRLEASLVWTDTHTGVTLNPSVVKKPEVTVGIKVAAQHTPTLRDLQKAKPILPKVVGSVTPQWKDRFDKGDTSFADVW